MILIPVTVCQILAVKVIVLIQIFPRRYYFLNSSKNLRKILKKTFRKSSMFITASDFWPKSLLKSNSTMDVFPRSITNLARTVIFIFLERLLLC